MYSTIQAALALALAAAFISNGSAEAKTRRPASRPAATAPAVTISPERAALLSTPATAVDMSNTALGWVKSCSVPDRPLDCSVTGSFALAAGLAPNLKLTLGTASLNGAHPLAIVLPLDVALRPGFTIALENGQAILGDYTTCSANGCSGEVGVPVSAYDEMMHSKHFGILVGNAANRVLNLKVTLDDLDSTVKGPATSQADITNRRQIEASRAKTAREKQAAANASMMPDGAATPK